MGLDNYIVKGDWKKYITVVVVSLVCLGSAAEPTHQNFQTVDDLLATVKQEHPDCVHYDTNGVIEGLEMWPEFSTDHNLRLLSKLKSVRFLLVCNYGGLSSNAIPALAEYPNLTGLGLVCCGSIHAAPLLPRLTNLQSLYLAQNSYNTNDAIYLAKMTNLTALMIDGRIPQTQAELLPLTNLVNLRTLVICGVDQFIRKLDTNTFSRLGKLTNCFITSDPKLVPESIWETPVWKTPPSNTNDLPRALKK